MKNLTCCRDDRSGDTKYENRKFFTEKSESFIRTVKEAKVKTL